MECSKEKQQLFDAAAQDNAAQITRKQSSYLVHMMAIAEVIKLTEEDFNYTPISLPRTVVHV